MGNALNALLRWMGRAACQYLRRSLLPTVRALSDLNFCFMALIGILFFFTLLPIGRIIISPLLLSQSPWAAIWNTGEEILRAQHLNLENQHSNIWSKMQI